MIAPTLRQMLGLCVPVMLANVAMPLQGWVDMWAVTGQDVVSLALGLSVLSICLVVFNFLQYATCAHTSQGLTQGVDVVSVLRRSLYLAVASGAVFVLLFPWIVPSALTLLLAPNDAGARSYLLWRFLGLPIELANYAFTGFLAGLSQGKSILKMQLFLAGVNIILTLILVRIMGLGVAGAGMATLGALILNAFFSLWLCARVTNAPISAFVFGRVEGLRQLFALNRAIFVRTVLLTGSLFYLTRLASAQGEDTLAAHAVLFLVLTLSSFALDGVSLPVEVYGARAFAQGNKRAFVTVARRCFAMVACVALMLGAIWALVIPYFLSQMLEGAPLGIARNYAHYAVWLPLAGAGAYYLDGLYFGLAQGWLILRLAVLSVGTFAIFCVFAGDAWGYNGVWTALFVLFLARVSYGVGHLGVVMRLFNHR